MNNPKETQPEAPIIPEGIDPATEEAKPKIPKLRLAVDAALMKAWGNGRGRIDFFGRIVPDDDEG